MVGGRASSRNLASPSSGRQRRPSSSWLETDLDSMHTEDVGLSPLRAPLYVNTDDLSPTSKEPLTPDDLSPPPPPAPEDPTMYNADHFYQPQDISEADDRVKRFYGEDYYIQHSLKCFLFFFIWSSIQYFSVDAMFIYMPNERDLC
jgi:hypothetical protein